MKIIITGGGTGGHITPALAIKDIINTLNTATDMEVIYVGGSNSMESMIIEKQNIPFRAVKTGFIERKVFTLKHFKTIFANLVGLVQSMIIMRKEKPQLVIGTGGFVTGPVVLAAKICKVKTIIHEQNAYPGITNRLLGRIVDTVMISFEESKSYFNKSKNIELTGNPLKKELFSIDRKQARKDLDISESDFFVYSFGGSGGQLRMNDAIIEAIEEIKDCNDLKWLHVSGKRLYNQMLQQVTEIPRNMRIVDYMHDGAKALIACDLVLGSGGAITLSEVTALGKPAILIPKGYTAENHQEKNARLIEKSGAAFVLTEKEVSGKDIWQKVQRLMKDKDLYHKMELASIKLGNNQASDKIKEIIVGYIINDGKK